MRNKLFGCRYLCLSVLTVVTTNLALAQANASPQNLRSIAEQYYGWRNETHPVASSDAGLHTWDDKLTDYSQPAVRARAAHVRSILDQIQAMGPATRSWSRDDRIGWLLFRSQLERA